MPAINFPRSTTVLSHKTIGKRSWAGEEPGVILDFVVVFIVLCLQARYCVGAEVNRVYLR
ncbi:uncharacterized protein BO88DRAFT_450767 [Aspergillus vadensis CBS 113365]|uniref:Uncharacterized protein n=1 Tax=Aspergillus vadensis (strain CBS 113365 / IMI 142717 / IBT 24658) TaxID=1448311 RepID=A0A319BG52_ASPVC|nr:hypothetical protein BO88DRAFT_450767 [Aspergillus vadensis CBS 113365]PYH72156.1 hypothetical protein BO88DRAFT_450767 [Aspergillus vadensis CBS 113365]